MFDYVLLDFVRYDNFNYNGRSGFLHSYIIVEYVQGLFQIYNNCNYKSIERRPFRFILDIEVGT